MLITGTSSPELLNGTSADDTIEGLNGSDTINGFEGNDSIGGGNDNDLIYGGSDNDTILGGNGADSLFGEAGDDSITGENSDDLLDGGEGNDFLNGIRGADQISGGGGNDTIIGGQGDETLLGGPGNDTFIYESEQAAFNFGLDDITDFDSGDRLFLAANSFASNFDITLANVSANGDLTEIGNQVATIVYDRPTGVLYFNQNSSSPGIGDPDPESFSYPPESLGGAFINLPSNLTLLLSPTSGGFFVETFSEVGLLRTSNRTTGNSSNNLIAGDITSGSTNDIIDARNGDDIVFGFLGNDSIFGGSGNDALFGNSGNDTLRGGDGNDTLTGSDRFGFVALPVPREVDVLSGGFGADVFVLGNGIGNSYLGNGTGDYALITDFNPGQGDSFILNTLGNLVVSAIISPAPGIGIFESGDLIAVVQGVTIQLVQAALA